MDSKKIFEKLFKIAENQQKVLTKLAQVSLPPAHEAPSPMGGASSSWEDVAPAVLDAVQNVSRANKAQGFGVQSAEVGKDGTLAIKMTYPTKTNDNVYRAVADGVKKSFMPGGAPGQIKTVSGKSAPVNRVDLIGIMV